jgi:hypothetical protein
MMEEWKLSPVDSINKSLDNKESLLAEEPRRRKTLRTTKQGGETEKLGGTKGHRLTNSLLVPASTTG